MALTKNVNFMGIQVPNAYIKVVRVSGDKSLISAVVEFRASSEEESFFHRETRQFSLNLDGPNVISQAYEYLKTLDDYVGAEDC